MLPVEGIPATAARARTFRTRQMADPAGFVRTFGIAVEAAPGPLVFGPQDAIAHAHPNPPAQCARGKVAAFSRSGPFADAVCFQLSDDRTDARVVGCCNAIAAAAALHAEADGRETVRLRVAVPGPHRVRVDARVLPHAVDAAVSVRQTWIGVPFAVQAEERVAGRRCAMIVGPFNDYLVLDATDDAPGEFSGDDAALAWRRLGADREPLLSRVAVLRSTGSGPPLASFFTCGGREHPSAPLTGLAVLALAAERLPWLSLGDATHVETRAGAMPLPRVRTGTDGRARVEFPDVVVGFDRRAP